MGQDQGNLWPPDRQDQGAGSAGNTNISGISNLNGQSGAPTFVQYAPYSIGNNFQLSSADTSAKDRGSASNLYSTDRLGNARPQGLGWDIGAYEVASSGGTAPSMPKNLKVVTP